MKKESSLLIIYTGGTIGMVQDPQSKTLKPLDFKQIAKHVPEIKRLNHKLDTFSFTPPIDSSNMQPAVWIKLAKLIRENYSRYDGFVILHGSDTMAYTASALSFMFENLSKPVILTGSQLPIGEIRTDAKENMITALEIAASKNRDGTAIVPEVCIFFDYKLFRGNRAKKYSSAQIEAFHSPNYSLLAEAGVEIKYNHAFIRKAKTGKKLEVSLALDTHIGLLKLFPGMQEVYLEAVLNTFGLKAVILEAFGSGNAPTEPWFLNCLKKAIRKGILIFDITQCSAGNVTLGRYETSMSLKKAGVIGGSDITTEAAVTKIMYLLGKKLTGKEIKKQLGISIRGELTIS